MQFSSASNVSAKRCLYTLFQNQRPIFCWTLFFEEYLNLQVRINKVLKKHAVDNHPSLSELTSRIHPLMFLWTPKGFMSP